MKQLATAVTLVAATLLVSGCGSVGGSPQPNTNVANIGANVLQFAVGTANLYGTANAGLNVVVTYRQPSNGYHPGDSGTLVNSPTLTVPAGTNTATTTATVAGYDGCSTVLVGPATGESTSLGSTTQNPGAPCATTQTSFGQSGGAFGVGLEPFNATAAGDFTPPAVGKQGSPFQVAPYPVPLYDPSFGADANAFVPWLGPPSFDYASNKDSIAICNGGTCPPPGYKGYPGGIDVLDAVHAAASGAYSLSVAVPANTGNTTATKAFTMPAALTNLGTATAPTYTADGSGGGTFAFTMPAGATEALVEITDYGPDNAGLVSCNGSGTGDTNPGTGNGIGVAVYYTIETTASGTLTLPDTIGPLNTPSVCTAAQNTTANGAPTDADQIAIQVIGFDYPFFQLSYPSSSGNPTPTILGANGEDDITISSAVCQQAAGACVDTLPLLRAKNPRAQMVPVRRRP